MSYFPQPTLFPRVSKTGETELWHVRPFFWKHFLEQALFQFFDMIQLTLMKGDERVEPLEEAADLGLLIYRRKLYRRLFSCVNSEGPHGSRTR